VSLSYVGIILRFSKQTEIQPATLFVFRLQSQPDNKVARRVPRKQSGASAAIPLYHIALAIV
jgi:hypothetical protein